ncbi:hypothetical protein H0H93_005181, partial [Arthromyces matolae]
QPERVFDDSPTSGMRLPSLGLALLLQAAFAVSSVTVYPTNPAATETAAAANYTGAAAYDPTVLTPPAVPTGLTTQFVIQLQNGGTSNLSLAVNGSFIGFSVEITVLQVPFLNLMANLAEKSGRVNIRVGGNSQETAVLVDSTPDGKILEKNVTGASNPTQTPPLVYTADLLYMMANISSLVNVHWFVGVPFLINDTTTRLAIAQAGYEILGDYLMGIQVGNEPDLYQAHDHYTTVSLVSSSEKAMLSDYFNQYGPYDYFGDFGTYVAAMQAANLPGQNLLVGPSIAYADWTTEQVWNTGFVTSYSENLAYLTVEKYLLADSVSQKANFTWAGQTFGDDFGSDGRPMGDLNITTIQCDTTTNLCTIPVPAPSYALVYLTDTSINEAGGAATTTFATTVQTKTRNTVTIDQAVLATSNGGYGKQLGSTSAGSESGAMMGGLRAAPSLASVLALIDSDSFEKSETSYTNGVNAALACGLEACPKKASEIGHCNPASDDAVKVDVHYPPQCPGSGQQYKALES